MVAVLVDEPWVDNNHFFILSTVRTLFKREVVPLVGVAVMSFIVDLGALH